MAKLIDLIVGFASPVVQNKLQRSELVIKLLKQLNLDPDHPPADFTAVYQYTLVEYGIGKPKPVLEMFRQAEIQAIFRKALEQNNPSLLLKNGETFLAGHSLGDQIQALGIDARQEFYQFAAVFIEVAKRTRTPAEVLTNQRLESLHRQISSIQDRLHRLPTLEAMRTEMARLAAQSYPMLPEAIATPALAQERQLQERQCRAFALAQQMKGWFETLGYRFEPYEVWQDDYFEWIIDIPVRRGRYDRILVRGVDGEVGLGDIRALRQSVETQRADEGWLVTARRISRAAREEVEKEENHDLGCYTFDELLDQDADFGGYLGWLESEIGRRGIDQKYVPLACTKEEIDPDTKQRIGVSRYDDRDGWIDGYIDLWLDDPAKEHISVLGEFGTGKTWFAFHYASQALTRYREAQKRGVERPRLPLVIPLRDYAKAVSVESLFSEFFFRKHEVRSLTYSAFEQLNRMGKLLLIFDGFDEMAARVDRQEMINNFWELAKVVVPGAKVILTCRTEHFPEAREGRALLNAQLQASTANLTGEMPQFEVLELEKFNDEQIRQVMSQQAELATVEQVMSNPQLLDLARRPVMTELILEALPDIEAGKPVDMSRVYLYAVRRKMERDIKEERTFTSMAEKLYFLCELSWEMLSSDRMSLNYREFPDRIRRLFGSVVQEEKDLDHWHYDMMGQTMLIRNTDGDYMPAHRSLLEFFVAYKFAAELGALAPDFIEPAQMQSCLDLSAEPQDYTWSAYFQRQIDNSGRSLLTPPLQLFTSEPLEKLRQTFGKTPLTKAVIDLILPMLKAQQKNSSLQAVLYKTRNRTDEEAEYVGGNVATLLVYLDNAALEGSDLSNTVIRNADFTRANLCHVNLHRANLSGSIFSKTFGRILSVACSPDGFFFATGDTNGEIHLWQISNGKLFLTLRGHSDWVRSVAISADGKTLVSSSSDWTIKLWDTHTGSCLRTLRGHTHGVQTVALDSSGTIIASSSRDLTVKIWNVQSGECVRTFEEQSMHFDFFTDSATLSPNGKVLATCCADRTIKLWNIQTGECLKRLPGHTKRINCIVFSSDGLVLASGSNDSTIKIWDIETGICLETFQGHTDSINDVVFNGNNSLLISGSRDGTVRLWQRTTGKCLKILHHPDSVGSIAVSSDGITLITSCDDQTVKLWNIHSENCIQTLTGFCYGIESIAIGSKSNIIAGGCNDSSVKLWNMHTGEPLKTLQGHTKWIRAVAISPDNLTLASAASDQTIRLWNIQTGETLKVLRGHTQWLASIAFSPNNELLASGGGDSTIRLWSVITGECFSVLKGHDNLVSSIAFSPCSSILVSGSYDKTIKLWNVRTGKCFNTFYGHTYPVWAVSISSNGELVASGSTDSKINLWNIQSGECLTTIEANAAQIDSLAFSPDNLTLASGGLDKTVRLWNPHTEECLKILRGHSSRVWSVTFSADGTVLASGSQDETIRLWDVRTGECIRTLKSDKPYEDMDITEVKGLTEEEKTTLKALGAIER
nr:pentapeptide repeat-containing protein [Leptolyngbya sp. FACHB-541]